MDSTSVWFAVSGDGREWISDTKPRRDMERKLWKVSFILGYSIIELPHGTIKQLLGYDLTWSDRPEKFWNRYNL